MPRVRRVVRVALMGSLLLVPALAAHAATSALAVHTAVHARHHSTHHHHAAAPHHVALRDAAGGPGPASLPARVPHPHGNHKAALPAAGHSYRHGSGGHSRHAFAAAATPRALAIAPLRGRVQPARDATHLHETDVRHSGRAPPRAGPQPSHSRLFARPAAGRARAARVFPPGRPSGMTASVIRSFPASRVCRVTREVSPKSEQPPGRSRADRPEGSVARHVLPSTRGSS
ncbi:MAG TPA: hypothetical protein VL332_03055 [Candidatus Saccharimonadaceae bacterium]|jgi:hypothetical protein|nr:hypothetical protein [Candidatus Saccharimonadaceae bacterium]